MAREEWYEPREIHYDRQQTRWMLRYADAMREGAWPPECVETGYIGGDKGAVKQSAPYEIICQTVAELDVRLARCGLDRVMVEDYYSRELTLAEIAKRYSMDSVKASGIIDNAFEYIASGSCQRWIDCADCCDLERCHRKKRYAITYQEWTGHYRAHKEVLAIIPAKITSRRLPLKNIRLLNGKPLIAHTINQAKTSKTLTRIIVTTDSDLIADIAQQSGAETMVHPHEGSLPVIDHVLKNLQRQNYRPSLAVLLQVTSPLRTSQDIDNAVRLTLRTAAESAISVGGARQPGIEYLSPEPEPENGAVYVFRPYLVLRQGRIADKKVKIYHMPASSSVDIDTLEDFQRVENILKGVGN